MTNTPVYLGIDLGGTKLLAAIVTGSGKILRSRRYPTGPITQQQAKDLMESAITEMLSSCQDSPHLRPLAIGIGMVGRVENSTGIWHEIEPGRDSPFPLAEMLSEKFDLPCYIDNDVRSAAKAEYRFGYGKVSRNFLYLNVGTGISVGTYTDGKLIAGAHSNAGEVGHTGSGIADRFPCVCGRTDCVETVASGFGIDLSARTLRKEYPNTRLRFPEIGRVHAGEVFEKFGTDALCTRLTSNAIRGLSNLIMNLVRFSDPDTIVLGGGLLQNDFFYQEVLGALNPHTMRFVTGGVVRTKLDPAYIGVLGAAANAIEGMERLL